MAEWELPTNVGDKACSLFSKCIINTITNEKPFLQMLCMSNHAWLWGLGDITANILYGKKVKLNNCVKNCAQM